MQKLPFIIKFIRTAEPIYGDVYNCKSKLRGLKYKKGLVTKAISLALTFFYLYELKSELPLEYIKKQMECHIKKYISQKDKYSNWELIDSIRDKCVEYQDREFYSKGMRDCLFLSLIYLHNVELTKHVR